MISHKLDSLQCFRGLAACGVVIFHAGISTSTFVQAIPTWFVPFWGCNFLGVDFFFVLSGFIILSSHFDDAKNVDSLKTYITKRFVRIFPPYWPVSIGLLILYFLLPAVSRGTRSDLSYISSILLLPAVAPPALSVAWTLIHEALFYMIFIIYFISNRLFTVVVLGWVGYW